MRMSDLEAYRDELAAHYGDVPVSRFRAIYGTSFAMDFDEGMALAEIAAGLDDVSLSFLARDHSIGALRAKIDGAR